MDGVAGRANVAVNRVVNIALASALLGLGATVALAVSAESAGSLRAPGGIAIAIGRVAGLTGAYLMLLMVLLMARIPTLERAVGQDRLARWHRRIGGWPIALITLHVAAITIGYAQSARTGYLRQVWVLLDRYPDVLAAAVGFGLLVMVGVASVRRARSRMRYETWWAVHLYTYVALSLAFAHQIVTGASFVGHPVTRIVWSVAWAATAGTVIVCRLLLPIFRTLRHQLTVVEVRGETPGVVSVIMRGRRLERLPVAGGQFFHWRFLCRGLWWQAHPYSLSAMPAPPYLRLTVRTAGDHGEALARMATGTKVAIEGPYGAFTEQQRVAERVLLIAAGVGVTPIRSLLEELPPDVDVCVVLRASSPAELPLRDELAALVAERGGRLHELFGSRRSVQLDGRALRRLVRDVAERDVYLCGPDGFAEPLIAELWRLGVAKERIHRESFAF